MEQKNNIKTIISNVIAALLYVIAAICLYQAYIYYNADVELISLDSGLYAFKEEEYVGGDAYNYIITASRSTAIMVKGLFWLVAGFGCAILGRMFQAK